MAALFSESDKQEISAALEEFNNHPENISQTLEQYLVKISKNGIIIFPWNKLKPLLTRKLDLVIREFQEKSPMNSASPRPNMEHATFEELHQRILDMLMKFNGAPFTIQRICELVTNPSKHYQKTEKFMRGLEKNLVVVTTVDSFGNRVVQESKQSSSLVNGMDGGAVEDSGSETGSLCDLNSYSGLDGHMTLSPYLPPPPRTSPNSSPSRTVWPHPANNCDVNTCDSEGSDAELDSSHEENKEEELMSHSDDSADDDSRVSGDSRGSDVSGGLRVVVSVSPAMRRKMDSSFDDPPTPTKMAKLDHESNAEQNDSPTTSSGGVFAPILGLLLGNTEKTNSSISTSSSVDISAVDASDGDKKDVTDETNQVPEESKPDNPCVQSSSVDPPEVEQRLSAGEAESSSLEHSACDKSTGDESAEVRKNSCEKSVECSEARQDTSLTDAATDKQDGGSDDVEMNSSVTEETRSEETIDTNTPATQVSISCEPENSCTAAAAAGAAAAADAAIGAENTTDMSQDDSKPAPLSDESNVKSNDDTTESPMDTN